MNRLKADPMLDVYSRFGTLKWAAVPACYGKTVLDIGGYDGRFGFDCFVRGAKSVKVLDNGEYRTYLNATGRWQEPAHCPDLEYISGDFMEWDESADIVLFFNVLYHCGDWLGAFPKLRALTKEWLCLSTYFAEGDSGWREYEEQGTGLRRATPTIPALLEALDSNGLTERPFLETLDDHVVIRCR